MNVWGSVSAGLNHLVRPVRRVFGQTFIKSSWRNPISERRHDVRFTHVYPSSNDRYSRDLLFSLRFTERTCEGGLPDTLKQLGLLRYRGKRAGRSVRATLVRSCSSVVTCSHNQGIPVIVGNRPMCRRHSEDSRSRVLVYLQRQELMKSTKIGLLNTQSIGNKFTLVADCITSNDFCFFLRQLRRGITQKRVQI